MKRFIILSFVYIFLIFLIFHYNNKNNIVYYNKGLEDGERHATEYFKDLIKRTSDSSHYMQITIDNSNYYFLRIDTIQLKQ